MSKNYAIVFITVLCSFIFFTGQFAYADCISIAPGECKTGSLDSAGETDTYCFSGNAGDRVLIRMRELQSLTEPQISLYGPDATELASVHHDSCAELTHVLPSDGQYTIQASDYGGNDTGGYGIFVQILNNPGNVTVINFGQTVSASIDSVGEMDTYTFSANAGDSILIRISELLSSTEPEIRLYGPDGNKLTGTWHGSNAELIHVLPSDGQYTILACDYGGDDTGGYGIFIQRLNNPGNGTPIGFGQTISGSIGSVVEMDTYTFSGNAGDSVLIRMSEVASALEPQVRLYGPDGSELANVWHDSSEELIHVLPSDGQYTVLACDNFGNDTGGYGIFVQRLNNPGNGTPIGFGQTISGSVISIAEADTYTFSASAGDSVLIRMSEVSSSLDPQVILYGPDGSELTSGWSGSSVEVSYVLPSNGQYAILACDYGGKDTGDYSIFIQRLNNPGNGTPIGFGQTISGSINPLAEADTYTFSASAGDSVLIRISEVASALEPQVRLYGPDGSELANVWHDSSTELIHVLPSDGQYTILACDSGGNDTGGYGIFVQRLNNPGNAVVINFGQTVSASIGSVVEMDTYTFSGNAGDSVLIRMSEVSSALEPQVRLYGPDGSELASVWHDSSIELLRVLPSDGQYTILACDYGGDGTGTYGIFVLSNATTIEFGQSVSQSISPAGDLDLCTFSATAGDCILLCLSRSSGNLQPDISIYSPDGVEFASEYSFGNPIEFSCSVPLTGDYTILIHNYSGSFTGSYTILLERLNNPGNTTTIGFGQSISESISPAGDLDLYTFSATAGDSAILSLSRSAGNLQPDISVYSPDGVELASQYSYYGSPIEFSCSIPLTGDYTILIRDYSGGYSGDYTLSLDQRPVEQLTLGSPYVGAISNGDWHLFSVDVEAGRNLLVTVEPSSETGILELYGRYSQVPARFDCDWTSKEKNIYGTYELLISPTASGTFYFGVYGSDVDGSMNYSIMASIVDRYVSDVYPGAVTNSSGVAVHILGVGFVNGMQVELQSGTTIIPAIAVVLSSPQMIIAQFDLSTAFFGLYDISIIWPDSQQVKIEQSIDVRVLPEGAFYSFKLNMSAGGSWVYPIIVPSGLDNLFVTLQKSTLVSYGNSWQSGLSVMRGSQIIGSNSGSHDLILQIPHPAAGTYTIKVTANQAGEGMLTVWSTLPELPMGQWVVGKVYCSYGSTWYQVDVPADQDKLCFEAESMGRWSHFDIYYGQYGSSNCWTSSQGTNISMEIPDPAAGTYIVEFMDSTMLYTDSQWSEDQTRDVLIKANTTFTSEPPPNYLPTIVSLSTDKGGNTGSVTVEIQGGWLDPNATVSLIHQDYNDYNDITAQDVYGDPNRTRLTATFDLTNRETGQWDLVVTNPDGQQAVAPGPFTIEQGGEPELWVEIIGRETIRVERPQVYLIKYGNLGTVDAVGVPLWIAGVPSDATLQLNFDIMSLNELSGHDTIDLNDVPKYFDVDGKMVIPLIVPLIPPHTTGTLQITITAPATIGQFQLRAWTNPPLYRSPLSPALTDCIRDVVTTVASFAPGADCLLSVFDATSELFAEAYVGDKVFSYSEMFGRILLECSGGIISPAQVPELVVGIARTLMSSYDIVTECAEAFEQVSDSSLTVTPVSSATPEDKYGPGGFDSPETAAEERKRFVLANQQFCYKVDFWNKEDATAPACDVLVKDQLDPNLDWNSFRFENVGFRKWDVDLGSCQYFNVNVDMRPDVNLIVNVEGTFDSQSGQIQWVFQSLDPATLQTPDDPSAGFLPPITASGEEVGWVGFRAEPKAGLPTGTQIKNQAFVEFDWAGDINNHPAPKEGPWLNTFDLQAPDSYVRYALPLSVAATECNFLVEWTGDDAGGSGIRSYDIYVSTDGSAYSLWLNDTNDISAVFTGVIGHTYAFYSVAVDNVGNVEAKPAHADATTPTASSQILVTRCTVRTRNTQGQDSFDALGTFEESLVDLSGITQIDVDIVSLDDDYLVYEESIGFDASNVVRGKFRYKGRLGAITSLTIDFNRKTVAIKLKNVNLTGLGCPLRLNITLGRYMLSGDVDEDVVNGVRRNIPIRLMRTYKDQMRVNRARARNSTKALADMFTVRGEIAVEDVSVNLANEDVVITWGGQAFTIPAGSFTVQRGNSYKCSKIATTGDIGLVTAKIDLDKCTFSISVKKADLNVTSGAVNFGISFGGFNEIIPINL